MAKEFTENVSQLSSSVSSTVAPTSAGTIVTFSTNPSTFSTVTDPINSTSNNNTTEPRFDGNSLLSKSSPKIESNSSPKSESPSQIEAEKIVPSAPFLSSNLSSDKVPITSSLPRNIGFVNPPSKLESCCSRSFSESFQQNQMPITTQISSRTDCKITPTEMRSLTEALRKAEKAIKHSKSKSAEKQKLTASLEKVYSLVIATSPRMSQQQANLINDHLKKLMTKRRKIGLKHKRTVRTGCIFIFLIFIMLLRMLFDAFSAVLVSRDGLKPLKMCLLAVDVLGFVFTGYMIVSFCAKSSIKIFESYFCNIWTMLYGIVTTLVIAFFPDAFPTIAICGYTSMITCIIQGCLNFCDGNAKQTRRKFQVDDNDTTIVIVDHTSGPTENNSMPNINNRDTWNGNSTSKNESTILNIQDNQLSNSVVTQNSNSFGPDRQVDLEMNAIQNLKNTIQNFLIEVNGSDYISKTGFATIEKINYKVNNESENNEVPNKMMTQVAVNQAGTSSATTNVVFIEQPTYVDTSCFWCCYSSNPHQDCLPAWYCLGSNECCSCCDCNDGCCSCDDCCGDCCEGFGDCCTGCCESCSDCSGECCGCCLEAAGSCDF